MKEINVNNKVSNVMYHWVFLFHRDKDDETPFQSYVRSSLNEKELPRKWLTGPLSSISRKKVMHSKLFDQPYSVFLKVEIGS